MMFTVTMVFLETSIFMVDFSFDDLEDWIRKFSLIFPHLNLLANHFN